MRFTATLLSLAILSAAHAAGKPEDDLASAIKSFYVKSLTNDWAGIEKMPGIKWAPLPPTELPNCLPDGGCYTRTGTTIIAGRNLVIVATGARTIVNNLYIRNATAPFGEAAVLTALKGLNLTTDLARCPLQGTAGSSNWYRIKSAATNPGTLQVQTTCNGRACEGFVLTLGEELPSLVPAQLKLYSEQCAVPASERKAVSTALPHEALAQTIAALIPLTTGPAISDWKSLPNAQAQIKWPAAAPIKMNLSFKNDPNPFSQSTDLTLANRKFGVLASGSQTQALVIHMDEMAMHPKGEHMLGVLYTLGFTVQLARCGPVYTESTNNWYSVKSAKTHPVMLRQSIRYDGNNVQDTYELRLDNTLPKRDPRDRDPNVAGCK